MTRLQIRRGSFALALTAGAAALACLSPASVLATSSTASNTHFVTVAYRDILGRTVTPDDSGLAYWTARLDSGTGRGQMGAAFTASLEYKERVVSAAYQEFLGRDPDAGGVAYYADLLFNGTRTDEDLAVALSSSAEFFAQNPTNAAFVGALYSRVLHRQADPGGLSYYTALLNGTDSRTDVASLLVRSQERFNQVVNTIYVDFLRRDADPEGLAYWTGVRSAGFQDERIITQFIGSVEYSLYAAAH